MQSKSAEDHKTAKNNTSRSHSHMQQLLKDVLQANADLHDRLVAEVKQPSSSRLTSNGLSKCGY